MPISDTDLAELALALEAAQHESGCWTTPPRVLAIDPLDDGCLPDVAAAWLATAAPSPAATAPRVPPPWRLVGEGDPYHLLDRVRVEERAALVLALVVHGWAFPPDDPASWYGRPSQHPGRLRARTATVVTPDRRQWSAIRLQGREVRVDPAGEGPLMDALLSAWTPPGERRADDRRRPAYCRRDASRP
jgi:hypothetical protein